MEQPNTMPFTLLAVFFSFTIGSLANSHFFINSTIFHNPKIIDMASADTSPLQDPIHYFAIVSSLLLGWMEPFSTTTEGPPVDSEQTQNRSKPPRKLLPEERFEGIVVDRNCEEAAAFALEVYAHGLETPPSERYYIF